MSTQTSNHRGRFLVTGQTAAGSNQATALVLPGRADSVVEVTTVASSTGVLLPPIIPPMRIEIVNQGSNTLSIYPQPGGTIDNGAANSAKTLSSGNATILEASSLTNWYTVATTAAGGGGTVTSVTFTGDGTVLSSTPSSAVTTSGTVTAALATQTANEVLAGPTSGSAAAPTFRSLVVADVPISTPTIATASISASQNNWSPTGWLANGAQAANLLRTTVTASGVNLTGLTAPSAGTIDGAGHARERLGLDLSAPRRRQLVEQLGR